MPPIKTVAIIGASGNFGTPITTALLAAGFHTTIITRTSSTTPHPPSIPLIRTDYTLEALTSALRSQDAVICVVGPGGIPLQKVFVEAAHRAGVGRFVVDDFGWGPEPRSFVEFEGIRGVRREGWDLARELAEEHEGFSWTGISTGNPIDWALKKFPMMGFDIVNHTAKIYDNGTEEFTGTTLEGIGQAVVGVLLHPEETTNRFCSVYSIRTTQMELLKAFEAATGREWGVQKDTTKRLKESGKARFAAGDGKWVLELVVATLFDEGEGRGVVAGSWKESDNELLGVREERVGEIVGKVLG